MNAMPPQPILPVRDIMGVAVTAATAADAVTALDVRIAQGGRVKLAFLNAHTSNLTGADVAYREILGRFTVLNDGVGVNIAARVLHGAAFPDNLNGTDFVPRYLGETIRTLSIYLLGAQPGIAEQAAAVLARIAPRHRIAGMRHGFFPPGEASSIAAAIRNSGADTVLVAMGNPAQERFIESQFDAMGVSLAIGVGALFDFLSGRVSRAPALVRKLRIEWIYRLALEPGRLWRRYILGNFKFIWRLLVTRLSSRRAQV